jgi:hypothetical protein
MAEELFQSADRDLEPRLLKARQAALENPFILQLKDKDPNFVALLNKKRQCLLVNSLFFRSQGIEDSAEFLGLRPGELLHCANTEFNPLGCGTKDLCQYCSILGALNKAINEDRSVEGKADFLRRDQGTQELLTFGLQIKPFPIEGEVHFLLFLR